MKKVLLLFFLLMVLLGSLGSALDLEQGVGSVEDKIEEVEDIADTLSDDDARAEYLKQEWIKMVDDKPWIREPLIQGDKVFTFLNPIWKFILRMEFEWSWLFFLTLMIWLNLLDWGYTLVNMLEGFYLLKYSKYFKWVSFLILVIFFSFIEISKFLSNVIISFISGKGAWWFQLISVLIVFGGFIFLMKYSRRLRVLLKLSKRMKRQRRVEKKVEKQEKMQKTTRKKVEEVKEQVNKIKEEGSAQGKDQKEIDRLVNEYMKEMEGYLSKKDIKKISYDDIL